MHRIVRFRVLLPHNVIRLEAVVSILLAVVLFTGQAFAVTRFYNRSLFIADSEPTATTSYTISFGYNTLTSIGSIDMKFCYDPIPYEPCVVPNGLDVSHATLSDQSGETGFSITTQTTNHIVLSRTPGVVGSEQSSYTLSGVVNPDDTSQSYSIRLSDYASSDASGPIVDLGSVVTQVETPILLETQVPPLLTFCQSQEVSPDCKTINGVNLADLGNLYPDTTLYTSSQMAIGTNAHSGYVITVNGPTMTAGLHTIPALKVPTASAAGTNQFGINLATNTDPTIGDDPVGTSTNTFIEPNYDIPNEFLYNDGDPIAYAPDVSLQKRFTISYIVNSAPNLHAGVYTTSLTFIASGLF